LLVPTLRTSHRNSDCSLFDTWRLALHIDCSMFHTNRLALLTDCSVFHAERLISRLDCSTLDTYHSRFAWIAPRQLLSAAPPADCSARFTWRSHRAQIAPCSTLDVPLQSRIAPSSLLSALCCPRIASRQHFSLRGFSDCSVWPGSLPACCFALAPVTDCSVLDT